MATFYYIRDKVCTLIDRKNDSESLFLLQSPNGDGVYDADIKEIDESGYIDASGINRKSYTDYEITAQFHFQNHSMNLHKLLRADEIEIPFSLGLNENTITKFVLDNREALYNYLFDMPIVSSSEEMYPYGSLSLEFTTVEPISFIDIYNMSFYRESSI